MCIYCTNMHCTFTKRSTKSRINQQNVTFTLDLHNIRSKSSQVPYILLQYNFYAGIIYTSYFIYTSYSVIFFAACTRGFWK